MSTKRTISTEISEDAHRVIRRYRVEGGLKVRQIIDLALTKLASEVEAPSRVEANSLPLDAV